MPSKAVGLGVVIDGAEVYAMANGLRHGSRGKVVNPRTFIKLVPEATGTQTAKGVRRSIRKALEKIGRRDLVLRSLGR